MATVTRYVDPDATGAGDGTSWTDAYTSLNAWEAAEQTDLVADGDSHIVYCRSSSGSADSTAVTIQGWTTDATHTITIQAADSDRAGTAWDATKYRLSSTTAITSPRIYFRNKYVTIDGIQAEKKESDGMGILYGGQWEDSYFAVKNCHLRDSKGNPSSALIQLSNRSNNYAEVYNNILHDSDGPGVHVLGGAVSKIYNNTVYNCNQSLYTYRGGLQTDVSAIVVNNISYNNGNQDFRLTANASSDYNFSKDDTAPGTNSIHGDTDSKTPDFVSTTSGSEDFAIASTSDAIDAGVGPSSDSNVLTEDIAGTTRSGTTCDIGAFEFVESGTTLTADTGTITIAGINATVTTSTPTNITATTGTASIAGINANVAAGRTFTASTGAVTTTGINASVSAGKTFAATTGTVAATGINATVSTGALITTTTPGVAVAGINAEVSAGKNITTTTGTVTATGINATVDNELTITATTGSIIAQGIQASISAAKTITATTAAVTATGINAFVENEFLITGTTGAVTATGINATIIKATAITALTGTVGITGYNPSIQSGEIPDVPAWRTATIPLETRSYTIEAEDRTATITAETRTATI